MVPFVYGDCVKISESKYLDMEYFEFYECPKEGIAADLDTSTSPSMVSVKFKCKNITVVLRVAMNEAKRCERD